MKILLIGDIVGKGGRRAVRQLVPEIREEYGCCFCIANGENAAGGSGLTSRCVEELKRTGVDVITSGDHIWSQKDFVKDIGNFPYVLRPANFNSLQPGKGFDCFESPIGLICVVNLIGRVFIAHHVDNPFTVVDRILNEVQGHSKYIFVDFHGEATSEKIAMGRFLDGRVTAVFGTHTHVQTADERIFPKGTAFISDVGMVGGHESVIGRDIQGVINSFYTGMPSRFKVVEKDIMLNGAVVEVDPDTGNAKKITRVTRRHS